MIVVALTFMLGWAVASAAGPTTLCFLLIKGVQRVRDSAGGRFDAVCDLIVSLLIWGALSVLMLLLLAVMSWGVMHGGAGPRDPAGFGLLGVVVLLYAGYAAAGWGLVRWASGGAQGQPGVSDPAGAQPNSGTHPSAGEPESRR